MRGLVLLYIGVLSATLASGQACDVGIGLVILDASPVSGEVLVYDFLGTIQPEGEREALDRMKAQGLGTALAYQGMYERRTLLFYTPRSYYPDTLGGLPRKQESAFESTSATSFGDGEWFRPMDVLPHRAAYGLRWIAQKDDWLRVVVDEEAGTTMWLQDQRGLAPIRWEALLTRSESVARREEMVEDASGRWVVQTDEHGPVYGQPLRSAPHAHAPEVATSGVDCYVGVAVEGPWIRVHPLACLDRDEMGPPGWVQWCEGSELLVWPEWGVGYGALLREVERHRVDRD